MVVGMNDAKFGKKRRFGNLSVVNKKGKESEGRERREEKGGSPSKGVGGVLPRTPIST